MFLNNPAYFLDTQFGNLFFAHALQALDRNRPILVHPVDRGQLPTGAMVRGVEVEDAWPLLSDIKRDRITEDVLIAASGTLVQRLGLDSDPHPVVSVGPRVIHIPAYSIACTY